MTLAKFAALLVSCPGSAWVVEPSQLHLQGGRWRVHAWPAGHEVHEILIAVQQKQIAELRDALLQISTPGSARRGQYLSYDEAHSWTANDAASQKVLTWLGEKDEVEVVRVHPYGHYIRARAAVVVWERILETKFALLTAPGDHRRVVRAVADVHLPDHLEDSVSSLFDTTQLPLRPRPPASELPIDKRSGSGDDPDEPELSQITPESLREHYGVNGLGTEEASQSVFAALDQNFSPWDLRVFQDSFNVTVNEVDRNVVDGHNEPQTCIDFPEKCFEANLDIQYLMAMSPHGRTTFWYARDFAPWIEEVAHDRNPPLVHSISYGASEASLPRGYVDAFDTEAIRLGTMGVTIFVSSGDDGVSDNDLRENVSSCGYAPVFPASSPWVTTVGATQGGVTGGEEMACSTATNESITTGGGFSRLYGRPEWQRAAAAGYFASAGASAHPGYNTEGRGYPDLALAGTRYSVVIGVNASGIGATYLLSGTSASTPAVAGMASLVNARLHRAGKVPLGFINPTIYANVDAFRDVRSGHNRCAARISLEGEPNCCAEGFEAATGWDPLTGLGSVDFQKFLAIFNDLPDGPWPVPRRVPADSLWFWIAIGAAPAVAVLITGVALRCCLRRKSGARAGPMLESERSSSGP